MYPDAYKASRHFGRYELDILIPSAHVAIEFDGPTHYSHRFGHEAYLAQRSRDATKDRLCKAAGIHLIRVRDDDYAKDPDGVVRRVLAEIAANSKMSLTAKAA
jgi:very-short-patch-repair endonuclease